jgi:hypothetical protein
MTKKYLIQKALIITLLFAAFFFLFGSQALAGTATLSWNANSESDLAGYKIYYGTTPRTGSNPATCGLCGYNTNTNVGLTSTPASPSYTITGLTDGTTYYFSVTAYDTSGNESAFSSQVSKNISASTTPKIITIDLQGPSSDAASGTLEVLDSAKALLKSYPFTTNSAGQTTINIDTAPGTLYFKLKAAPYLTRLISGNINTTLTFPQLKTGDINQDNIINSIDFSILNANWFTSNASSDLNRDGVVNSIDFSLLNGNWFQTGET